MNYLRDFFFFTKSKLVTFAIFVLAYLYLAMQQSSTLGNIGWDDLIFMPVLIYVLISIIWFSYRSWKHFIVGLIIFGILMLIIWTINTVSASRRATAMNECDAETEGSIATSTNDLYQIFYQCMSGKGYKKYR
jgi:hypothetical protein